MNPRHLASGLAVGALLFLAFGSVPSSSGGSGHGKQAVKDLAGTICKGEDPFKLPIDDEAKILAAIKPHLGNAKGIYVARNYELMKGQPQIENGWVTGKKMETVAVEAAGQICSNHTECDGNNCVIKENILDTWWELEFRDGATDKDWVLVGYFMGNIAKSDATRAAAVGASQAAWKASIISELGDGMPVKAP